MLEKRPYKTLMQPYTTYFTLVILCLLTLTNGFDVFFPGRFTAASFLAAYITIPMFLMLYFGHKFWFGTPLMYQVNEIDVLTGKDEADRLEEEDIAPIPRNVFEKIWFWLA